MSVKFQAEGFFILEKRLHQMSSPPVAIKGQITGPFTFATGIHDAENRAIFYNDRLRGRLSEQRKRIASFGDDQPVVGAGTPAAPWFSINPFKEAAVEPLSKND